MSGEITTWMVLGRNGAGLRLADQVASEDHPVRYLGLHRGPPPRLVGDAEPDVLGASPPWEVEASGQLLRCSGSEPADLAARPRWLSLRSRPLARAADLVALARWGPLVAPSLRRRALRRVGGAVVDLPADWPESAIQKLFDSGGEYLTEVQVDGFEVRDGRVSGVRTEFGFECADRVVIDLAPAEVTALIPRALASPPPGAGDAAVVLGRGRSGAPCVRRCGGPAWAWTRSTSGEVAVYFAGSAAADSAEELVRRAELQVGEALEAPRVLALPGGAPRPPPGAELAVERWVESLLAVGLVPTGSAALGWPVAGRQERAWARLAHAGATEGQLMDLLRRWLNEPG